MAEHEVELVYRRFEHPYAEGHRPTDFIQTIDAVIGKHGAVSLTWVPRPADDANILELEARFGHPMWPSGWDLGFHSRTPVPYAVERDDCEILNGRCFYDGSSRRAVEWLQQWQEQGMDLDWLRQRLRDEYRDRFYQLYDPASIEHLTFNQSIALLEEIIGGGLEGDTPR